jgi:hypothetical protein
VTQAYFAIIRDRTGDTEGLQALAERYGDFGGVLLALLYRNGSA